MANTQKKTSARCLKAEVHLIGSMACAEGEAVRRSAILAEDWTKISSAYSINKNERLNHLAEGRGFTVAWEQIYSRQQLRDL